MGGVTPLTLPCSRDDDEEGIHDCDEDEDPPNVVVG